MGLLCKITRSDNTDSWLFVETVLLWRLKYSDVLRIANAFGDFAV